MKNMTEVYKGSKIQKTKTHIEHQKRKRQATELSQWGIKRK